MLKIYILHHPEFINRKDYFFHKLREENIDFEIIDKYDPNEIDYDEYTKNHMNFIDIRIEQIRNLSYQNFSKKISKESLSLVLKHMHCWNEQIINNIDNILIMEDDIEIPKNFKSYLETNITEYIQMYNDIGVELLMIGTAFDMVSPNIIYNKNIHYHSLQKTRCTHAYIINKNCSKIMLEGFNNINLPIDFKMNEVIQLNGIKVSWSEPGIKQKKYI